MILFSVAALMIATLFAGAALYISLVEHPARLTLDDAPMLAQWQPSYNRALPIQASLAMMGGAAGITVWLLGGQWSWLAGGVAMLANWPLTMLVIMPINKRLMAMSSDQVQSDARSLLLRWGRLHDGRSALGSLASLLFASGLLGWPSF